MADRRRILGSADRYTLPSSACCNNVSHFRPQSPGPSCPRLRPHQDLVCDVRRQTSHRLSVQPRAAERRRMADAGCYRGWNRPQRRGHTRAACCRRGACRRDGFSRASRVPPGLVIGPALTMALWRTSDCVLRDGHWRWCGGPACPLHPLRPVARRWHVFAATRDMCGLFSRPAATLRAAAQAASLVGS